MLNSLKPPITY